MNFGKSIAIALMIGLVLLAGGGNLPGQSSLSIGNTLGYPGLTVTVPVRAAKATNLTGAQFDVSFNPAKVSAGAPTLGTANAGHMIRSREIAPGVRRTVVYSLNNALLRTNGFTANMPFQVAPNEYVTSGPLVAENVKLARRDSSPITPVTLTHGSIFVRPVNPLPDGSMQFFLPSQPDKRYVIQASTNLLDWINISNTVAFANFMDLVDVDAPKYPYRFYRSASADALGSISGTARLPDGSLKFQISGLQGRSYVIQASTDLERWTDLSTNTVAGGTITFIDMNSRNFDRRFYRLKSQ